VAVKLVRVSDLSGRQATEEEFAKLIVHEHPQYQGPITLDVLPEELGELPTATSKGKPAAQRGRELGVDGAAPAGAEGLGHGPLQCRPGLQLAPGDGGEPGGDHGGQPDGRPAARGVDVTLGERQGRVEKQPVEADDRHLVEEEPETEAQAGYRAQGH